jgi:LmbE family N-acetylglucosaminyl deacetylase
VAVDSFGRALAISPHLDDAVLSAGSLIAAHPGSVVLTVFAGVPERYDGLSEWDAACGFHAGDDVVMLRRDEDRRAAERLGAQARWLDFLDDQYDDNRPSPESIAEAIRVLLPSLDVDTIAMPLGIYHADHRRTYDACELLLENQFDVVEHWVAWADIPYRARHSESVLERLESLRAKGFSFEEWSLPPEAPKRAAICEYATQVSGLGAQNIADAELPEQFYSLRRA